MTLIDVVKLASKNRLTIPRALRKTMGLEKGDIIAFIKEDKRVYLVKISELPQVDNSYYHID